MLIMVSTVQFDFKLCVHGEGKIIEYEIFLHCHKTLLKLTKSFSSKKNPVASINPYAVSSRCQLPETKPSPNKECKIVWD